MHWVKDRRLCSALIFPLLGVLCLSCEPQPKVDASDRADDDATVVRALRDEVRMLAKRAESDEVSDEEFTFHLIEFFYKRGLQWPVGSPNGFYLGGEYLVEEADPAKDLYVIKSGSGDDAKLARLEGSGVFWIDGDGIARKFAGVKVDEGGAIFVNLEETAYFIVVDDGRVCVLDGRKIDGSFPEE